MDDSGQDGWMTAMEVFNLLDTSAAEQEGEVSRNVAECVGQMSS